MSQFSPFSLGPVLSFFGLVFFGVLLAPFTFLGVVFVGVALKLQALYYGLFQNHLGWLLGRPRTLAISLAWTLYTLFSAFLVTASYLPFLLVHFLLTLGKSLIRLAPLLLLGLFVVILSQGTANTLTLFSFGLGTIVWDFLYQTLSVLWLFPALYDDRTHYLLPFDSLSETALSLIHQQ